MRKNNKKKIEKNADELFNSLYKAALLDEDFQQQRIRDLQQIPPEKQHLLNAKEQVFINDTAPSPVLMQQLKNSIKQQHLNRADKKKTSFWKKWFSHKKQHFSFLPPTIAIPSALAFGMFFGVLFAPLFTTPTPYVDHQFRGANSTSSPLQASMEGNPQYWLSYISSLIKEGKLTLATEELQRFKQHYPDFEQKK